MTGALHPLDIPVEARGSSSRLSAGSAHSNDSGYVSRSPSPSSDIPRSPNPSTSSKGKGRAFGFHSFFGRPHKAGVNSNVLDNEQSPSTSSHSGEISIPVPSGPVSVTTTSTM